MEKIPGSMFLLLQPGDCLSSIFGLGIEIMEERENHPQLLLNRCQRTQMVEISKSGREEKTVVVKTYKDPGVVASLRRWQKNERASWHYFSRLIH